MVGELSELYHLHRLGETLAARDAHHEEPGDANDALPSIVPGEGGVPV